MAGTRKLPMVRRETTKQRSVTFTKRRQGLFSKAADLCRIGNAQVAIMATSVCRKDNAFSFGHPSADAVFDLFLKHSSAPGIAPGIASGNATMRSTSSLCEEITKLENELKNLMKNKEENIDRGGGELSWDCLAEFEKSESVQELQAVVQSLEILLGGAKTRVNDHQNSNTSSNSITASDGNSPDSNGEIVGPTDSTLNHYNDHVEIPTGYDDFDFVWNDILQHPNSYTSDTITTSNGNSPTTGSTDHGEIPTADDDFNFVWDDILQCSNSSTPGPTSADSIRTSNAEIHYEQDEILRSSNIRNNFVSNSNTDGINTPWTAFKSTASGFPDNVGFTDMGFVDCASKPPAPNSNLGESGSISAADYGLNDLVAEYGDFLANDQGLPLLTI